MGRHAENGESAPPGRGKRAPKIVPEPVGHDEPIGRRLRPEESAVTEAGTGFLGSGWSAESEPSEPSGPVRTEERLPGGRKMMLLAVAAMVVVLGGTVVGVQAMTGPAGSSTDCPPGGCVLAASNPPVPQPETTGPDGEPTFGEEPGDEPREGTEVGTAEPVPTPTTTRRSAAAASEPSPTRAPKATRAPRPVVDEPLPADAHSPADEPEPVDRLESGSPEPADRPALADVPEPSRSPASAPPADDGAPAPATTESTAPEATTPAAATAIRVDVDLVKAHARSGYTVKVVVAADESLDGVKLSLPVNGRVSSVSGAGWKQVGDTLVIESGKDLEAGEKLVVNFTAHGRAEVPESCESSQGECAVA